jgi:hypothetical protein
VLAYHFGISFSLDASVLPDTARLFGGSVAYGVIVVVSAGTLMLAISSLSRNSRYVGAMWMGIWIISNIAMDVLRETIGQRWCKLASFTQNLKRMCEALLDTDGAWGQIASLVKTARGRTAFENTMREIGSGYPWYWSAGVLLGLVGISLWILSSRVKSLDRLR